MSKGARVLGAVLWVLIILSVVWWCSEARAQGKNQTLCYPPVAGSLSCQPVSPTTPYPMKALGLANVAAPTYVEGAISPFSFDLNGNLRVTGTVAISGGATAANQVATQAPVAPATATATKSDLIGCQATSAAINPTTGQQAAINCDLNNNILTSPGGAPNITTSQVTVTTSSTSVCPVRALRRSCSVTTITGSQQVFCSGTTATTGNGQIFPAVVGASFPFQTTAAVNCIAVSVSQVLSVVEVY